MNEAEFKGRVVGDFTTLFLTRLLLKMLQLSHQLLTRLSEVRQRGDISKKNQVQNMNGPAVKDTA